MTAARALRTRTHGADADVTRASNELRRVEIFSSRSDGTERLQTRSMILRPANFLAMRNPLNVAGLGTKAATRDYARS